MQKKGALELSISTIVVVVIGVTLLTLGLVFVKGIFGKLTDLSGDIFDKAGTELGSITIESKFSVPSSIEVKQGKQTSFKVMVGHDGTLSQAQTFTLDISPSGSVQDQLPVDKVRVEIISEEEVTLQEGQQATFVVGVAARSDAPLKSGPYRITAKLSDGTTYDTGAVIVSVVKGRGLF